MLPDKLIILGQYDCLDLPAERADKQRASRGTISTGPRLCGTSYTPHFRHNARARVSIRSIVPKIGTGNALRYRESDDGRRICETGMVGRADVPERWSEGSKSMPRRGMQAERPLREVKAFQGWRQSTLGPMTLRWLQRSCVRDRNGSAVGGAILSFVQSATVHQRSSNRNNASCRCSLGQSD